MFCLGRQCVFVSCVCRRRIRWRRIEQCIARERDVRDANASYRPCVEQLQMKTRTQTIFSQTHTHTLYPTNNYLNFTILHKYKSLTQNFLKPNFGIGSCWLQTSKPKFRAVFISCVGDFIMLDILIFVLTAAC